MSKKSLDAALERVEEALLMEAAEKNKMAPYLDAKLRELRRNEEKIESLESHRKSLLKEMQDLLELAGEITFQLTDGYRCRYANSREIKVNDFGKFLSWMKQNKNAEDIKEFLEGAIKKTSLKKFVEKEIENLKIDGHLNPEISGISSGTILFRRLTTDRKGVKHERNETI